MANPQVCGKLSVHEWLEGIAVIPMADFTRDNVRRYMSLNAIHRSTLQPYVFFSSKRYARNLIFKNEVFECVAMCWDIGQASSIHDHNDKLGWMCLAEGR